MTERFDYTNYSHNLDAESFQILYEQYKDALKIIKNLKKENEQLQTQISNLEHIRDFCAEYCERLEKENEELKSEIKEVRGAYKQLWMRL